MNIEYDECRICGVEVYPWWSICENCEEGETGREIYIPLEG